MTTTTRLTNGTLVLASPDTGIACRYGNRRAASTAADKISGATVYQSPISRVFFVRVPEPQNQGTTCDVNAQNEAYTARLRSLEEQIRTTGAMDLEPWERGARIDKLNAEKARVQADYSEFIRQLRFLTACA